MTKHYCPYCGAEVHQEAVVPPAVTKPEDIWWDIWFCDQCHWVSDWPGMPEIPGNHLYRPITDPAQARWRKEHGYG